MSITIYNGSNGTYIILTSNNEAFRKRYGSKFIVRNDAIYQSLAEIAGWANNVLGEECLFEVG